MIGQTLYEANAREMKLQLELKHHNWRLRDKTIQKNREDNEAIRRRLRHGMDNPRRKDATGRAACAP